MSDADANPTDCDDVSDLDAEIDGEEDELDEEDGQADADDPAADDLDGL